MFVKRLRCFAGCQSQTQGINMKWYSARIVTQCKVNGKRSQGKSFLFDESVVIIRARSAEDAYRKAHKYGKQQETVYVNSGKEKVSWHFCGLFDLEELLDQKLKSGVEISSVRKRATDKRLVTVHKNQLTVFWLKRQGNKTAAEILGKN